MDYWYWIYTVGPDINPYGTRPSGCVRPNREIQNSKWEEYTRTVTWLKKWRKNAKWIGRSRWSRYLKANWWKLRSSEPIVGLIYTGAYIYTHNTRLNIKSLYITQNKLFVNPCAAANHTKWYRSSFCLFLYQL